jgi:hypothetical protein
MGAKPTLLAGSCQLGRKLGKPMMRLADESMNLPTRLG